MHISAHRKRTLPDSLRKYADSITTLTTELIADQKVTEEDKEED